jgi:adenylate cyclase
MTQVLGAPVGRALPARVRARIDAAQNRSEILIGWLQLGAVIVFGTLYALSPKTAPDGAGFQPAALALGAYALFTVLRLAIAYKRRLPGWLVAISAVADMGLLLGMIWSFHLQYEQPPSFYLKIPTLLYVFIFISLRALRFEALYVILAGAAAAIGWSGMVAYAVMWDDGGMMVTRDYIYYMTNNAILIGAEFDKIISILMVTIVLAVAIARARRTLEQAVADAAAAEDMSRFLAPEVVAQVTESEARVAVGEGDTREAAVLFLDIRNFTPMANVLPPADVISLLTDYQARFTPILRRHGGVIDKFLGDGILASFGAAKASETYARDACAALAACMDESMRWASERQAADLPPIQVIGAAESGRVIYGAVGDSDRLEMTVIGDAVNLAAKLEKHTRTEARAALVPADMYALAEDQGFQASSPDEHLPARAVEGVAKPIDLVALSA